MEYKFTDILKRWDGDGGWYYVRLPKEAYSEIKEVSSELGPKRGFGAVKVKATIGKTSWETSIFPDSEDKSYILFIKKAIRTAESLEVSSAMNLRVLLSV